MNVKIKFFLVWLILIPHLTAQSANPRIFRAIDLIFKEDYQKAATVLDSAIVDDPENPEGYFYRGVIYWRESTLAPDFTTFDRSTHEWLERCRNIAGAVLVKNNQDANAWFYHGGAHGFMGSMYARNGKWLKTGYHAWKGISSLEKALEIDPEMFDIYYGLGLYHVMAGHQGPVVRFIQKLLPIPTGDAAKGLEALKISMEKGRYARIPAQSALVFAWLYFENDYQKALNTLSPLLEKYPANTDLLCMMLNALFYLELNQPQHQGNRLLDYVHQMETVISHRNQKINVWWQRKFIFLKGFAHYTLGNDEIAIELLEKYSDFYHKHGNSYLTGLTDLMLGKIYESQGQRELAKQKFKQAKNAEKFGNVCALAEQYLTEPDSKRILPIRATVTGFPERP